MALISNFAEAGDGIVTAANIETRKYLVDADFSASLTQNGAETLWPVGESWIEITETETREWVGLTYAAALSQKTSNTQPSQVTGEERSYSYDLQEDTRVVGSYKLTRKYQRSLTYCYLSSFISSPAISVASGQYSKPFSVTFSDGAGGSYYKPTLLNYRVAYGAWNTGYAFPKTITISAPTVVELRGYKNFYRGNDALPVYSAIIRAEYT